MYQGTVYTIRLAGAKAATHSLGGQERAGGLVGGAGGRVGGHPRKEVRPFHQDNRNFQCSSKSIFHLSGVSGRSVFVSGVTLSSLWLLPSRGSGVMGSGAGGGGRVRCLLPALCLEVLCSLM